MLSSRSIYELLLLAYTVYAIFNGKLKIKRNEKKNGLSAVVVGIFHVCNNCLVIRCGRLLMVCLRHHCERDRECENCIRRLGQAIYIQESNIKPRSPGDCTKCYIQINRLNQTTHSVSKNKKICFAGIKRTN